jgi:hypothetical protein
MVLAMDEVVFCLYFFKLKVELITDAAITRLGFLDTKRKEEHEIKKGYVIWHGKECLSLNF